MTRSKSTKPRKGISAELFRNPQNGVELVVDGEIDAVDLTRRLAIGGLEMVKHPNGWALIIAGETLADKVSDDVAKMQNVQSENARLELRHRLREVANLARQARSVADAITEIEQFENERNSAGECIYAVLTLLDLIHEKCE